jgi:erythrose-4-phosphate dehydrogenase
LKPIRLAINGYGRIGRSILRALWQSDCPQLEIVAINEPADIETVAHLTRYDSTFGRFQAEVKVDDQSLIIDGKRMAVFSADHAQSLPWADLDVDIVLECSGAFSSRKIAELHLAAGAKQVIFSQPAQPDVDATVVYGVNHRQLSGAETIISTGSCTTNCIVPVLDVLHRELKINSGMMNTIHSAMNDQPVIDAYHHTDLRKTRSASQSIIPVDTGLATGIARFFPDLADKLASTAVRVPTVNVSSIDLTVNVDKSTDAAAVNGILKAAAKSRYDGILGYTEEPLASCDFNQDPRSGIIDAGLTRVANGQLVKVFVWFDNEWAYANRMLDVCRHLYQIKYSDPK